MFKAYSTRITATFCLETRASDVCVCRRPSERTSGDVSRGRTEVAIHHSAHLNMCSVQSTDVVQTGVTTDIESEATPAARN